MEANWHHAYVARSRWRGGMYGPASGIWSELTLHRGAAAAGEAETINNRATHLLCVCRFCTYSTITGTIWGRRAVG